MMMKANKNALLRYTVDMPNDFKTLFLLNYILYAKVGSS